MQKIVPFLSFPNHDAEEAAKFYVTLLPDSRIDTIVRSPIETPSGPAGSVLTVEFTLAGLRYVALNGGKEIACGWLSDRWGLTWQITPTRLMELIKDPDTARAQRAMAAMMNMVKIDIAAIEKAADAR